VEEDRQPQLFRERPDGGLDVAGLEAARAGVVDGGRGPAPARRPLVPDAAAAMRASATWAASSASAGSPRTRSAIR